VVDVIMDDAGLVL